MFLKQLKLKNFRNLKSFEKTFSKKTVLITGPNGSGKSSLLEAITMLSLGSSLKAAYDPEVITKGEESALVLAWLVEPNKVKHHLAIELKSNQKRLGVDGKVLSLIDFVGFLPLVSFAPSDLNLLSGSPRGRRQFLDRLLSLLSVEYLTKLAHYKKVLKNRNRLLRTARSISTELSYWDEQFAGLAAELLLKRQKVLQRIGKFFNEEQIGLKVKYLPSPRSAMKLFKHQSPEPSVELMRQAISTKLASLRASEQKLGFSLVGPQRDDFRFFLTRTDQDGLDLGTFGSRGEQRMALVSLKRAELSLLGSQTEKKPILLLDDIFSELDPANQREVFRLLDDRQVFMTAASSPPALERRGDFQVIELKKSL